MAHFLFPSRRRRVYDGHGGEIVVVLVVSSMQTTERVGVVTGIQENCLQEPHTAYVCPPVHGVEVVVVFVYVLFVKN